MFKYFVHSSGQIANLERTNKMDHIDPIDSI